MIKILKEKKAITLIALVITIVVLVILAVVTISLTVGNDGLIARAIKAANDYKNAQEKDKQGINDMYGEILVATDGTVTMDATQLQKMIDDRTKDLRDTVVTLSETVEEQQATITTLQNKLNNVGQVITKTNTISINKYGTWTEVNSATWTIPAGTWIIDTYFCDSVSSTGLWGYNITGITDNNGYWKATNDWITVHSTQIRTFNSETTGHFRYYQKAKDQTRDIDITVRAIRIK